eukprot:12926595-Prorocentrum_lima.AAC.1
MTTVSRQQGTTLRKSVESIKRVPITSKDVVNNKGEFLADWKQSMLKDLDSFQRLEGLAVATPQDRSGDERK